MACLLNQFSSGDVARLGIVNSFFLPGLSQMPEFAPYWFNLHVNQYLLVFQHQATISLSICKAEYTSHVRWKRHLAISSLRSLVSYQVLPKPVIPRPHKTPYEANIRASYVSAW